MRKIIDNRRYDTETAELVGEYEFCYDTTDFHYMREALYRKRTGEYFIYGEGGPFSPYAERVGLHEMRYGEEIHPVDYVVASAWAEEHLDADAYEAEFGEVPEGDEEVVMISPRIPVRLKTVLERHCSRTGKTQNEVIAELLETLVTSTDGAEARSAD